MLGTSLFFNEFSPWWLLLCLAVGLAYAWFLYSGVKILSKALRYVLFAFRALVAAFLCLLLLSPLLKQTHNTVERAVIVIAQDNSSSILLDKENIDLYTQQLPDKVKLLADKLSTKFKVDRYSFGHDIQKSLAFDYTGKQSNISEFIEGIKNRYSGSNLGAIILMSDGLYNQGGNPLYSVAGLKSPVYTIALGDTVQKRDILLGDVAHEKIVFLKNDFQVGVNVLAHGLGQEKGRLNIKHDGETVFSKLIDIRSADFRTEIKANLPTTNVGMQKYEIELSPLNGEVTMANNRSAIFVDVIDDRHKILLLANSPHPDLGAIRKSLKRSPNYQLETLLIDQFNASKLSDYDLVILHQLPSNSHSSLPVWGEIKRLKIPYWCILGKQTDIRQLNRLGLPLNVNEFSPLADETLAQLNPNFHLFRIDGKFKPVLNQLPPLLTVNGNLSVDAPVNNFFEEKSGETPNPIFFFSSSKSIKSAWLMGEGLWKWRLTNGRLKADNAAIDEMIKGTLQYLTSASDRKRFRVDIRKPVFYENEEITFTAQLYNKSYEPINNPEIQLTIKDAQNKSYPFVFSREDPFYHLNAGTFPPGDYTYVAHAGVEGLEEVEGSFMVDELLLEDFQTKANHQLLHEIAQSSGGKMIYPNQIQELYGLIDQQPEITSISHQESSYKALINFKWLFFVLMALIFVEWMIRKRNGLI